MEISGHSSPYPIQLFAAHDFAVLSYQRLQPYGTVREGGTLKEVERRNREGCTDRRSVQSSIDSVVNEAIASGVIDEERIGIAGLSDAAVATTFALIHSSRFKTAVLSTCCDDRSSTMALPGPVSIGVFRNAGVSPATDMVRDYWMPYSLELNAERISTPILMQLADMEYVSAVPTYTALLTFSKPVEMYVFPNELHIKWHPAHRLSIYERNIDWFDFWLTGKEDAVPEKIATICPLGAT